MILHMVTGETRKGQSPMGLSLSPLPRAGMTERSPVIQQGEHSSGPRSNAQPKAGRPADTRAKRRGRETAGAVAGTTMQRRKASRGISPAERANARHMYRPRSRWMVATRRRLQYVAVLDGEITLKPWAQPQAKLGLVPRLLTVVRRLTKKVSSRPGKLADATWGGKPLPGFYCSESGRLFLR